jgi:PKD repeat protein
MNANNEFIEDTINYSFDLPSPICNEWDAVSTDLGDTVITGGLLGVQRIIFLPVEDRYFTFYIGFSYCDYKNYKVMYSEFAIDSLYPKGKMIKKDIPIIYGDFCDMVHAVRHGNGRDWWVVFFSRGHKSIYTALLTNNGIEKINEVSTGITNRESSIGQICFSPDGTKIAFYIGSEFTETGSGFAMMDFDRCDGSVSNLKYIILTGYLNFGVGIAFSNDSKFLFAANGLFIRQYNVKSDDFIGSEKIIAEFDGFGYYDTIININYLVNFNQLNLGSDGKIYIFSASAMQRYLSVIDYPYEDHTKVKVKQHNIYVKLFTRTGPNIADFRLGPLDNSPCDTLGLDNDPAAKFRYEADTLDHLMLRFTDLSYFRPESWSWDFGDGSPVVEERYPYHRFPKNGSYKVCLTVSNENSSNTVCRSINISTSATDEPAEDIEIDISLYPNPVEDILQVTLGEYIPENGLIKITDISGRKALSQRLYYGQNVVDMSQLASGFYFCLFMDGHKILKTEKVVKME